MRGISEAKIEATVSQHPAYSQIDALIQCRAARGEDKELIYAVSCMFDLVENTIFAEHQVIIQRKGKRLRIMAWTVYWVTVIVGGLYNETPWITSPATRTCILTGAVILLLLYLYGRQVEAGAAADIHKSYPFRKAHYIAKYLQHLGLNVIVEELTEEQAKNLPKI